MDSSDARRSGGFSPAQAGTRPSRRRRFDPMLPGRGAMLAAVLAALLGPADRAGAQLADSTWPDYGGGIRNTHQVDVYGPAAAPTILWSYEVDAGTYPFYQPALGEDGAIFFLTYPGGRSESVYALNPDGTLRWSAAGTSSHTRYGRWPAAGADGQLLYMRWTSGSAYSASIRSRSQADGSYNWGLGEFGTSNSQTGPTAGPDGTIYAGADTSDLAAFDPVDGTRLWWGEGSGFFVNPAIAPNGSIVSGDHELVAIDPAGDPPGKTLWSYPADSGKSFRSVAIDESGVIYAGQTSGNHATDVLVALSPAGATLWSRTGLGSAPALGPDGNLYVAGADSLYALESATGRTLWSYPTGQIDEFYCEGVTVDAGGNVYLTNIAGELMSLSPDGQPRWELDLAPERPGNAYPSAPVIGADGTIYVGGGYTGKFFAVTPEPSSVSLAIVAALGWFVVWRRRR